MGMYVCQPCADKYGLSLGGGMPHFGFCETCQNFQETVWVMWTSDFTRFGPPISEQFRRKNLFIVSKFPPPEYEI